MPSGTPTPFGHTRTVRTELVEVIKNPSTGSGRTVVAQGEYICRVGSFTKVVNRFTGLQVPQVPGIAVFPLEAFTVGLENFNMQTQRKLRTSEPRSLTPSRLFSCATVNPASQERV